MDIYLGKSKTGKSKFIYDAIDEDIKNKKNVILFVPSQSRVITEKQYMTYQKKEGIIGVNITTIGSYVQKNIKKTNLHFDENYMTKLDRKIILTKVILKNPSVIKVFKNAKSKQGFLDLLDIYMDILKKSDYDFSEFENINFKNKLMEHKIKEIVKIYNKYLEETNGKYVDSIDEMQIFIKNILNGSIELENTKIYFDGYNNFTNSEYDFISALIKNNNDIKISLTTDITCIEDIYSKNTSNIFEISNSTYLKLLKLANENKKEVNTKLFYNNYSKASKDIVFLADKLFQDDNSLKKELKDIEIILETNKYTEIESIAKIIKEKTKKGYKYSDFCIYTTNIEQYSNIVSKIFYEYDIALYIDENKNIELVKLVKYIQLLMEIIIKDKKLETVIEMLKLNLNEFESEKIYEFQNYILEFNVNKYNLSKEFYINNQDKTYDLQSLNDTRIQIKRFIEQIELEFKIKQESKQIVEKLYNHLVENKIFENYFNNLNNENQSYFDENFVFDINTQNIINDINTQKLESQVWVKISEVFNSICKVYENEDITLKRFYDVFNMSIKNINLKGIPPTKDQVNLIDINVSRIDMKKQVFFVGVNENEFPQKIAQDIFFSDEELQNIEEKGIKLKETSISKLNMQLFNIYLAMNNIYEKLYIFIPSADVSGKALRKSSLITLIQRTAILDIVGNVIKQEEIDDLDIKNFLSKDKVFEQTVEKIKEILKLKDNNFNIDEVIQIYSLYKYFLEDSKYKKILNYTKKDENLDKETLKTIFQDTFKTSVSKLEAFERCPFSYFMEYVLNIKPEKKYEISNMDVGSFMHNVLEKFSMYLLENNIVWHELTKDEKDLEEKYKIVLYDIIEKELEYSLKKHKESVKYNVLKKKLINTMTKVIVLISRSFNQSEFTPYGYEIEFKEGAMFAPIEIQLENQKMHLIGKIDRIDTLEYENNMYARVIDYKSSAKDLTLENIKQGISLQLITYLTAFIDNIDEINKKQNKKIQKVIPSAMLYFNLSDKIINLSNYIVDKEKLESEIIKKLRMKGIFLNDLEIIEKMDKKLDEGDKRLIDISKKTLKGSTKSNRILDEEEFTNLCKEAKIILKNIGEKLVSGIVKIEPNKKTKACEYCKYSTICRKGLCI